MNSRIFKICGMKNPYVPATTNPTIYHNFQVANCNIDLLEDTRIKCQEVAPPVMNDSVINVRIPTGSLHLLI